MSEASKRLWITSDDLISFYHTRAATNPVIDLLVPLHIEPPDKPALQFMEVEPCPERCGYEIEDLPQSLKPTRPCSTCGCKGWVIK